MFKQSINLKWHTNLNSKEFYQMDVQPKQESGPMYLRLFTLLSSCPSVYKFSWKLTMVLGAHVEMCMTEPDVKDYL